MTIRDIQQLLNASILCGENFLDKEVHTACGADMMSDVLAFNKDQSVLLTGLCNPQVVRTAEMMDIICLVFVRGKSPDQQVVDMALEQGLCILVTTANMFDSCGILYSFGLRGGTANG